jgi:transcriptional regulator
MYTPEAFRETDRGRLHHLIDAHPFATLVVSDEDAVEILHAPCLLDRSVGAHGRLRFHVARANVVAGSAGRDAVAVFHGPDAYVSSSWYGRPARQVPTWNYAVVHARGRLEPLTTDELRRLLADMAAVHERGAERPIRIEKLDPEFFEPLLAKIVGFAVPISRLDGKFKLSQNRSPEDRARVARALAERGRADDIEMVGWMT